MHTEDTALIGALVLLLLGPLLPAGAGRARAADADPWARLRQAARQVRSIRAEFTQSKEMRMLRRPLVSRGRFMFKAPGSTRWEYTSPLRTVTLVHQGTVRRFVHSKEVGRFVPDASAGMEGMRVVAEQMTAWLCGRFSGGSTFSASLADSEPPLVVLTPREPAMARFIRRVEILFSSRPGVVQSVTIIENEKTSTVISFEKVQINRPLPDRLFEAPR